MERFVFKDYDFDRNGFIKKEDVRVVLSYVPLQKKYSKLKIQYEREDFKDRVESQNELFDILNKTFDDKDKFDEHEFINVIENISSDIFSDETIKIFMQNKHKNERSEASKMPKPAESQKIVSPSLKSKFISSTLKTRTIEFDQTNILNLYTGTVNNNNKAQQIRIRSAPSSASTTAISSKHTSKQSKSRKDVYIKCLRTLKTSIPLHQALPLRLVKLNHHHQRLMLKTKWMIQIANTKKTHHHIL